NAPAGSPLFRTVLFSVIVCPGDATAGPEIALITRSGSVGRVGVHVWPADIVTVAPQPASVNPLKVEPRSGVTVSATVLFGANPATQSAPQLIPAVPLVIVPLPAPAF